MTFDVHALLAAVFFVLIVMSSNQPVDFFDPHVWSQLRIEERSYNIGYSGNREPFGGYDRKTTAHPRGYHPMYPGYHPPHGYNGHRRYDQDYHHGNRGATYPNRNNRKGEGENSDALSRRTIDVGQAERGQQSLGDGKRRKREDTLSVEVITLLNKQRLAIREQYGVDFGLLQRLFKPRIQGVSLAHFVLSRLPRDVSGTGTVTEESVSETDNGIDDNLKETGRAVTAGPDRSGGYGGKRPNGDGKGPGFRRGSAKPKQPTVQTPKRNNTQNLDFVFPDSRIFLPRNTSCSKGTTYCENIGDDYPEEYIREILKKEGQRFKEFLGRDTVMQSDIAERVYIDETDLCPTIQRIIFPTKAKNKDEKWQFVINQDGYTQGIGVETCVNAEKPCSMTDGFPLAYRTFCKQKFITRRLLSLNENGGPGMNEFLFPSCCVCTLQAVGLSNRSKTRS